MSYTCITTGERVKIETYLGIVMSIRSIARRNTGYESGRAQRAKTKLDDRLPSLPGGIAFSTIFIVGCTPG